MAKYTMRVKEILENYYNERNNPENTKEFEISELSDGKWENPFDTTYMSPFERTIIPTADEVLASTWAKIFDFSFPKLPDYADGQLEIQILKAYYMREIGFETVERWKLALNQTLNRIMPYYIELYKSTKFEVENPLENYDLYDNSERNTDSNSTNNETSTSNNNGNSKQIFEDTPSNELSPMTNYATSVTKNETENNDTGNVEGTGTNHVTDLYGRHVHGLMGYSKQDIINRYRDNLINIDELIIMELRDLFMLVY